MSRRRVALITLWLAFVVYAFFLAPPPDPADPAGIEGIKALLAGQGDALAVALFNLMGVIPALYLFLLIPDAQGEKLPAWPFGLAMFGVGAFALLPYLIFRRPQAQRPPAGKPGWVVRLFGSRILGALVGAAALALAAWGIANGHLDVFLDQWRTSRFIHVMTLDFVLCVLLFPVLIADDLARRGGKERPWLRTVALIPLFGPIVYLALRPQT
jgi:hypothetical protein